MILSLKLYPSIPFFRVPTLCDFEPLNQHVQMLHQLVQAAQSVDEMSQTITDLLSEQKVKGATNFFFCHYVLEKGLHTLYTH